MNTYREAAAADHCPSGLRAIFTRMTRDAAERRAFGTESQRNQHATPVENADLRLQLLPAARASNNSDETEDPSTISCFLPFFARTCSLARASPSRSRSCDAPRIVSLGQRQNIRAVTRSCPLRYTFTETSHSPRLLDVNAAWTAAG